MTKKELQEHIGKKIVDIRKQKGLKQYELADKIEIEDSALRRIERGNTNCTLWMLWKICIALDITLEEFFKE